MIRKINRNRLIRKTRNRKFNGISYNKINLFLKKISLFADNVTKFFRAWKLESNTNKQKVILKNTSKDR